MSVKSILFSAATLGALFAPVSYAQSAPAKPVHSQEADDCKTFIPEIDAMARQLTSVPVDRWNTEQIAMLGTHKISLLISNVQKRVDSRLEMQETRILAVQISTTRSSRDVFRGLDG